MQIVATNLRNLWTRRAVFWICVGVGPLLSLRYLPWITTRASLLKIAMTIFGLATAILLPIRIWKFVRDYRRGIEVAIVTDGVLLRIPNHRLELIPWSNIRNRGIERPGKTSQSWSVYLECAKRDKPIVIGGDVCLFPGKDDAQGFVEAMDRRMEARQSA